MFKTDACGTSTLFIDYEPIKDTFLIINEAHSTLSSLNIGNWITDSQACVDFYFSVSWTANNTVFKTIENTFLFNYVEALKSFQLNIVEEVSALI